MQSRWSGGSPCWGLACWRMDDRAVGGPEEVGGIDQHIQQLQVRYFTVVLSKFQRLNLFQQDITFFSCKIDGFKC